MCGLAGILSVDPADIDRDVLGAMQRAVLHRGPDDQGLEVRPDLGVGLAFTRLAIIDLTPGGHQPMWSPEGDLCVVFNGEIYNHGALRRQLESLGRVFRSRSDTEVLLAAYRQWGEGALERLDGMFAAAFVDLRGGGTTVTLVRDRLGEKPMHYWHGGGALVFGSEIKSLLACPLVPRAMSSQALDCYLALGYVPAPLTMFDGIRKLPAGHLLTMSRGGEPAVRRWWDVSEVATERRLPGLIDDEVRYLVQEAVRTRLESDVPMGAFLSGGVDSTIVVALMSQLLKEPVRTFAAAFEIGPRSFKYNVDADLADRVAAKLGGSHTRLVVRPEVGLWQTLEKVVASVDEPHANPTLVTTYLLAGAVRERGLTVMLTGDGSDEIFGGYRRYQLERLVGYAAVLPEGPRRLLLAGLRRSGPAGLREVIDRSLLGPADRYLSWWEVFPGAERRALIGSPATGVADLIEDAVGAGPGATAADAVSYLDVKLWLAEESNVRTDRMTMAHSLESRAVFEDHRLVERAMRLSIRAKSGLRPSGYKRLLRRSFADVLPREVMERPKWGWLSPVHYWVNDHIAGEVADSIAYLGQRGVVEVSRGEAGALTPNQRWLLAALRIWHEGAGL